MKKKIIIAIVVLGIAIGSVQVNAQNERIRYVSEDAGKNAKLIDKGYGLFDCTTCDPSGCCAVLNCN